MLRNIKDELLERMQAEQLLREAWDVSDSEEDRLKVKQIDEENTTFLSSLIDQYGWPKISDVGEEVAEAAWLIAQHTPDKMFRKQCLELMQTHPQEVDPKNLVRTIDRVRILDGEPQYYGTHFTLSKEGKWLPQPIEDEEHVNQRRAAVGLGTIEEKTDEYNQ